MHKLYIALPILFAFTVVACSPAAPVTPTAMPTSEPTRTPEPTSTPAPTPTPGPIGRENAAEATELRVLEGHTGVVQSVAWSPDGTMLASGGGWGNGDHVDSTVRLWDAETGQQLAVLDGHTAEVLSVDWSPDGHTLQVKGMSGYGTRRRVRS